MYRKINQNCKHLDEINIGWLFENFASIWTVTHALFEFEWNLMYEYLMICARECDEDLTI